MDKTTINTIINFLKTEIKAAGLEIKGIALFGSQLSGNTSLDSDIDLIIVSDNFENKNMFERADLTMQAEINTLKKFQIPIDVLKMTNNEFSQGLINKRYNAVFI